jgi:hypothetical protein
MTIQAVEKTVTEQPADFEQKVKKLREIYADASDISKAAPETVIRQLRSQLGASPPDPLIFRRHLVRDQEGRRLDLSRLDQSLQ